MNVKELTPDQRTELKQAYLAELTGESLSFEELAKIDEIVTDEEIFKAYENVHFVIEDFFCTSES